MSLSPGEHLNNRYRIDKIIGRGGYGAVYYAYDTALKQACAIKENLNTTPAAQRQFEREAVILAGLRHSNLPRVIDYFFIAAQGQYLVMDFVEGQSLHDILETQDMPLGEEEALAWIGQVCQALMYLHHQKPPIIHRDVKPQNIIITPAGQAVLVDFGLSKIYDERQKTSAGTQGVTFGYAPPEQYGQGRTDTRSDVYALGATLYTMLTGQCPPDAIKRLMNEATLVPPRQFNSRINRQIEQAIFKAMGTTTSDRFQSVEAFYQALTSAPRINPARQAVSGHRQARSLFFWSILAGGIILALSMIGLGWGWFAWATRTSETEATTTASPTVAIAVFSTGTSPATHTSTATNTPSPTGTPSPTNTPLLATSTVTPTNTPTPVTPSPTLTAPSPPSPETPLPPETGYQFTPTSWSTTSNQAIIHFKGQIRDEAGNPVNGYSVLADNGSWSVLTHPTGASHHYPESRTGAWDLVLEPETGAGWWTLTVVRYECPNFEQRFDAQCKQFTRLSEDIKVEVVWPDEAIINADWVCHWGCDKGLYQ